MAESNTDVNIEEDGIPVIENNGGLDAAKDGPQSDGCPASLRGMPTATLLEGLRNESENETLRVEAKRRIASNPATRLAVQYLLGLHAESDEAFDRLVGYCFRAKGNLSIPPVTRQSHNSEVVSTREFIQERLLEFLAPYREEDVLGVMEAALNDRFRYIGRRIKMRMIDEIRRRNAAKNREPERAAIKSLDSLPYQEPLNEETRVEPNLSGRYWAFLNQRKDGLNQTLGNRNHDVLLAHFDVYPDAYQGTFQQTKSAVTRAIQARRGVSEQQARANKRDFHKALETQMKADNGDLRDLYTRMSRVDDDHTFREEWINGKGQKMSRRFRI